MRVLVREHVGRGEALGSEDHAVVGDHHALGHAGGARGVEDGGEVVALAGLDALLQLAGHARLLLAPALPELLEGEDPVAVSLAFHEDDVVDLRQLRLLLAQFGELLLVLGEDQHRARVLQDVLALLGRVGLVDGHRHGRREADAQVAQRPLQARAGEDGDHLALLHPERDQAPGHLLALLRELRPGDVLPGAFHFAPRRDPRSVDARLRAEELRHRLRRGAALLVALCGCHTLS